MISIKRIVEQIGLQGQYYDLGKDFSNFRRTIDGADDQIQQRFEKIIGKNLVGKRIRARASIGYKQYIRICELDVVKITLDNYYDNYVVVAHDNTTPKPKEYFLKSGFKVEILGPATGQPSPQTSKKEKNKSQTLPSQTPLSPEKSPDKAQSEPMAYAPPGKTPTEESLKEDSEENSKEHTVFGIDEIELDVKEWLSTLLVKPDTTIKEFIPRQGYINHDEHGKSTAVFVLSVPKDMFKPGVTKDFFKQVLHSISKHGKIPEILYKLNSMNLNSTTDKWEIHIVKTIENNRK